MVEKDGWVTLRAKSYHQAQERQRVAEALQREAERARESALEWGQAQCAEWRRLAERTTYLYGLAAKLGATEEQLRG